MEEKYKNKDLKLGLIELKKINSEGEKVIHAQMVKDNTQEIAELLCELRIIDDFDDEKAEKIIELGMALASHDGELNI